MSTRKKKTRPTAAQCRRRIRTAILQRWDQLADDISHLAREIREAPPGTFDDDERDEAAFGLSETCWYVMVNDRPMLPPSERRNASSRVRERMRMSRQVLAEMEDERLEALLKSANPVKFRAWLRGEVV